MNETPELLEPRQSRNPLGGLSYYYDIVHPNGKTGYAHVSYRKLIETIGVRIRGEFGTLGVEDSSFVGFITNFEPYAFTNRRYHGYGKMLLDGIELHARSLGAECLFTVPSTDESQLYFPRRGFRHKDGIYYKILQRSDAKCIDHV